MFAAALFLALLCCTSFDSAKFLGLGFSLSEARVSGVDLARELLAFPRPSIDDIVPALGAELPPPSDTPFPENDLKLAALEFEAAAGFDEPVGLPGAG